MAAGSGSSEKSGFSPREGPAVLHPSMRRSVRRGPQAAAGRGRVAKGLLAIAARLPGPARAHVGLVRGRAKERLAAASEHREVALGVGRAGIRRRGTEAPLRRSRVCSGSWFRCRRGRGRTGGTRRDEQREQQAGSGHGAAVRGGRIHRSNRLSPPRAVALGKIPLHRTRGRRHARSLCFRTAVSIRERYSQRAVDELPAPVERNRDVRLRAASAGPRRLRCAGSARRGGARSRCRSPRRGTWRRRAPDTPSECVGGRCRRSQFELLQSSDLPRTSPLRSSRTRSPGIREDGLADGPRSANPRRTWRFRAGGPSSGLDDRARPVRSK